MNRTTIACAIIFIPLLALVAAKEDTGSRRWIAIDGDTARAPDGERVRLLRIDAPEMPGGPRNCQRTHCPPGDPYASQDALQRALNAGNVECIGNRRDMYGRRLAECFATAPSGRRVNISDWMLATGHAELYRGRR